MKKKKVVALLLAAAMTTASFMPSTGFFNVTEVQAESYYEYDNNTFKVVDYNNAKAISQSSITLPSGGAVNSVTTGNAIIQASPAFNSDGAVEILVNKSVTFSALITNSAISSDALKTSLGAFKVEVTGANDDTYTSDTSVNVVTKSFGFGASNETTTGVAISTGAISKFSAPGLYKVRFTTGSTTIGAVAVVAKVTAGVVQVTGGSIETSGSSIADYTYKVSGTSLKYQGQNIEVDFVSGGKLHYQWFYNEDEDAEFTENTANTWTQVAGNDKADYKPNAESYGALAVRVNLGFGVSSEGAVYIKAIKRANPNPPAASITASGLTFNDNELKVTTASYLTAKKDTASKSASSLKYSWYSVSKEFYDMYVASRGAAGIDWDAEITKGIAAGTVKGLTTSSALTNGGGKLNIADYADKLIGQYALVKIFDKDGEVPSIFDVCDGVVYESGLPYAITAGGLYLGNAGPESSVFKNDGKLDAANLLYVNDPRHLYNTNTAGDSHAESLVYKWYVLDQSTYQKLNSGVMTASGLEALVDSKDTSVTYVTTTSIRYINIPKTWKNQYVAVIMSSGDFKDLAHVVLVKSGVSYTPSATGDNSNRRSSSTSSGSTSGSTSSGSSSGSNGTTGSSSTTGTNTSGTTNTPAGTTPTTNVVENADGSKTTTTTETKADGSTVETSKTEFKDGSTLEVTTEKKADGTVIETTVETAANGDKATTVYTTSPNGTKSKKVSIVKADGSSETTTITENTDGSATIVNETKDASGSTSVAYSLAAGAAGVTVDKIDTTAKKVVIPAKIAIAGGAATLKGVTALKANTLSLEGKTIKVTKVGAAALKGNKTATNLVIGKNIKTIGKQAFMNATKVKTVNFKGNVNTIGKNSFKNINKKATIKIKATAKQFKALKKKIKNKGAAPAKVTYKRVK